MWYTTDSLRPPFKAFFLFTGRSLNEIKNMKNQMKEENKKHRQNCKLKINKKYVCDIVEVFGTCSQLYSG